VGKQHYYAFSNKLISSDSGESFYNNQPLSGMDSVELRRDIVMLPQAPAIFNGSIKDNLLIGLKFSERPLVSDNQLYEVLELVKLNKELN